MTRTIAALLLILSSAAHAAGWDKLSGQISRIREPQNVVVRNQAEWEALWLRHSGELKSLPGSLKEGEIVVAVFLGERRTAGVKVVIDLVPDPLDASKLVVFYEEQAPQGDGMQADVVTSPFAIVKLAKPYKSVSFAVNRKCKAIDAKAAARMGEAAAHAWVFAQAPRFD